jgi:KipI family sensor histidine kinase inhibitor
VHDHSSTILPTQGIRYGANAWLIEFASVASDESFAIAAMIRQQLHTSPPPQLREITFSYTRVLLEFAPSHCPENAPSFQRINVSSSDTAIKTLEVCYDGEDLDHVAKHCGMTIEAVIHRHSEPLYRVHCLGFAPGFPYLSGLPTCLHTPRLPSPRLRIPAGSVAIGAGQTGIYPLPTAGGWNLIGRIRQCLFDPSAPLSEATFLQAGDSLRFIPVNSFSSC